MEYRKKVEVGMQDWCLALGCRWDVSDKYFNNPPRPNGASSESSSLIELFHWVALPGVMFPLCYDNCLRRRRDNPDHILTEAESTILALMDRIQTQIRPGIVQDVIDVDTLAISAETPKRPGPRQAERLLSCRKAIIEWRSHTWLENYGDCAWGPNVLLPDAIVTKLATRSHISSVEDIKKEVPDWVFVDDYGSVVLDLIRKADDIWKEEHASCMQTPSQ
jgi:hypothetical protein